MSSSSTTEKVQKTYHTKATGNALITVEEHSHPVELKLYGGCFCPFVQRVWIVLELSGLEYQYIEVDPYKKPKELLDVNPRGLVPALAHGDWGCYESTVLMEYVDDISERKLLPEDPKQKAYSRLWADHISRNIVPTFYRYLQAQEVEKQAEYGKEFEKQVSPPTAVLIGPNLGTKYPALMHVDSQVNTLLEAADPKGPFFAGTKLSFVDVMVAPWILRCPRVLQPYRGWQPPSEDSRFGRYISALESERSVKATTSDEELYLDSDREYKVHLTLPEQRTDQTLAKWQKLSTRAEDCLEKGLPEKLNLKNA
ncbi:Glutathione S-transferase [Orbilia oligospora]|nr:Glutathione S-transferase [Orbilia oligospora]